jgi:hypothetical protein
MINRMSQRFAYSLAALLAIALAACSGAAPPMATTLCDLPIYPQRLVQLEAQVGVRPDGRVVIVDAKCPAIRIDLRLTGAAARAGFEERLKKTSAGLADPASVRLPAKLTGVFTGPPGGSFFTAEAIVELAAGQS